LKTQLHAVEASPRQLSDEEANRNAMKDCLRNIEALKDIDKRVAHVVSKSRARLSSVNVKPSKKRWLCRRWTLTQLTAKVSPICQFVTPTVLHSS
jgi:hypothetical protein